VLSIEPVLGCRGVQATDGVVLVPQHEHVATQNARDGIQCIPQSRKRDTMVNFDFRRRVERQVADKSVEESD